MGRVRTKRGNDQLLGSGHGGIKEWGLKGVGENRILPEFWCSGRMDAGDCRMLSMQPQVGVGSHGISAQRVVNKGQS